MELESNPTLKVVGIESVNEEESPSYRVQFLGERFDISPYPQVVLCGLYVLGNIAAISTEYSHKGRFLCFAIPYLNVV